MRQAVFISGKGSNLKALLDSNPQASFFVFANRNCEGLSWAKRRGFVTEVVSLKTESDWEEFGSKLNFLKIKRIFLLGFMKVIPGQFLDTIDANCINLHPSVLPKFPGLKSIERSYEANEGKGCSLHEVVAEVDKGKIILQKAISTKLKFEKFKERVHQFEQRLVGKHIELTRGVYG